MKLLAAFALLLSANLWAAYQEPNEVVTVSQANLLGQQEIEINYSYAGGCEEHDFQLEFTNVCTFSYPRRCLAEIVDRADVVDSCEAQISESKIFKLDPSLFEVPTILLINSGEDEVVKVDLGVREPIVEQAILSNVSIASGFIDKKGYLNIDLTARVLKAGNSCQAEGVEVELVWENIDQKILVQAIKKTPAATAENICILIYRPVFVDVKTSIKVLEGAANQLVLKNLQELENDYILDIY